MTFVPLLYLGLIHTLPAAIAACSCWWCSARPPSKVRRRPGVASFADSLTWRCRPPRLRATCTPSPGRLRQSHSQHSVSLRGETFRRGDSSVLLTTKEKYLLYCLQAVDMHQLAVSTLCRRTNNMVL